MIKNRISSEYVPRLKVLIFADLYRTYIVENTQVQYCDNRIGNCTCTRIFSTMPIQLCIKFASINALFLATFSEFTLCLVRTNWKATASYVFERVLFTTAYIFFLFFVVVFL